MTMRRGTVRPTVALHPLSPHAGAGYRHAVAHTDNRPAHLFHLLLTTLCANRLATVFAIRLPALASEPPPPPVPGGGGTAGHAGRRDSLRQRGSHPPGLRKPAGLSDSVSSTHGVRCHLAWSVASTARDTGNGVAAAARSPHGSEGVSPGAGSAHSAPRRQSRPGPREPGPTARPLQRVGQQAPPRRNLADAFAPDDRVSPLLPSSFRRLRAPEGGGGGHGWDNLILPSALPDPRMRRCRPGAVDIRSPCQTDCCRYRGQLFTALSITSRLQCGGQY